ncbi:hypothetical protein SESBI_08800 [Sesbania bispinosa]|nr:hypothetical protein SESBI_08800 [Sesbania bispinosa]
MDPRVWHKVAAISGVAALGLGTYGAHVFKPQNPSYKEVWHTASLYHLVHTAALVASPITKHPNVFGGLLTAGILAFSGTMKSLTSESGYQSRDGTYRYRPLVPQQNWVGYLVQVIPRNTQISVRKIFAFTFELNLENVSKLSPNLTFDIKCLVSDEQFT